MTVYETDLSTQRFPGIAKAAIEMAYRNGGVNRYRRESGVLLALNRVLLDGGADLAFDLKEISDWLASLSDDQLLTVVDGGEAEQVCAAAPPGTGALLDKIFEHVA